MMTLLKWIERQGHVGPFSRLQLELWEIAWQEDVKLAKSLKLTLTELMDQRDKLVDMVRPCFEAKMVELISQGGPVQVQVRGRSDFPYVDEYTEAK